MLWNVTSGFEATNQVDSACFCGKLTYEHKRCGGNCHNLPSLSLYWPSAFWFCHRPWCGLHWSGKGGTNNGYMLVRFLCVSLGWQAVSPLMQQTQWCQLWCFVVWNDVDKICSKWVVIFSGNLAWAWAGEYCLCNLTLPSFLTLQTGLSSCFRFFLFGVERRCLRPKFFSPSPTKWRPRKFCSVAASWANSGRTGPQAEGKWNLEPDAKRKGAQGSRVRNTGCWSGRNAGSGLFSE